MKDYIESKKIADHILSVMAENKETNREEFLKWLAQNSASPKCVENLSNGDILSAKVNALKSKNKSADLLFKKIAVEEKRRHRLRLLKIGFSTAACVAILFISFNIFNRDNSKLSVSENENNTLSKIKPIVHNENVILLTGTGDKIVLYSEADAVIANASIKADMNDAVKSGEKVKAPLSTIITPRGADYSFTLSDGSRVWINENSKLEYPVTFDGETREVILEGEAYFEVEHDEKRPFIVKSQNNSSIKVLGTKFNISTEGGKTYTTLVDGSVEVKSGKSKVIIRPSEQAVISQNEDNIMVQEVDVTLYTAWKEGKFAFKDKSVEDIMIKIAQWYDVSVDYENESVKNIKLSGMLRKYDTFKEIMEVMEATGLLDIRVEDGNNVKISRKK